MGKTKTRVMPVAITENENGISGIEARTLGGWTDKAKTRIGRTLETIGYSFAAGLFVGMSLMGWLVKEGHVVPREPPTAEQRMDQQESMPDTMEWTDTRSSTSPRVRFPPSIRQQ